MLQRSTVRSAVAVSRNFCAIRPEPCQAESLIQIGTRSVFTEEHDSFRESVRKFFNDKIVPFHAQWEEDGAISREAWLQAGSQGLLGALVPEQYGGPGADILYSAIVWEEQSYSGCSGPGFALHSEIVVPYILNYGTEEQKQKYLPKLVSGEMIGAIAMTEPGAGSDLAGVKTTAIKQADGSYLLNGQKTFITNGQMADLVIVVAKTDVTKGAHGVSLVIVERDMKGFERGRNLKKMGMKAQDTSELFFDNVVIPPTHILGGENKGFYHLMKELPQERLIIADMSIASSEACFEWTRTYTKDRKVFGKTVYDFQTTRHKLAEMKTEISVGRAFVDSCLRLHSQHALDSSTASMAKYWASDLQNKIADQCVQLHGGYGYMWEYPVTRAYSDARVQRIYGGTNEIMKELIARSI
eukprot:TRINITY_DN3560_c0_g1_i1.p1 TRINITY_DN3560_c0_g1~~TRINITY_DN3560_c0_g1_i1.p1  ORF type:complete len:412 (-),score=213.52 TRINITY_DN3560_c0_g1_i1:18-1253(-)